MIWFHHRILTSVLCFGFVWIVQSGAPVLAGDPPEIIRICTFNIQNFGPKKAGDPARVSVLAGIIRKYDIVAVQEISDVSGAVPQVFLEKINDHGNHHYAVACSERTGRQPDDKTKREQYAIYYDTEKIVLAEEPTLYDDSAHDYFAREPFMAEFAPKKGGEKFIVVTVHTDPNEAVKEIGDLDEVVAWAETLYSGEKRVITLGDFNASCTYATPAELDKLEIRGPRYHWVVPDSANTNLSEKSDCAYDRIVLTKDALPMFTGQWGVDRSFTSREISDHWPVWAEFRVY